MIALPTHSVICEAPIRRDDRHRGDLLPSEESASFLLWAWPGLLGWPRTVNWLFSPVVGNTTYPGDLWGLDSRGDLLIVETKLARTGTRQDPFVDFVTYCRDPLSATRWDAQTLRDRWNKWFSCEEGFLRTQGPTLRPDRPLTGTHPGVLPYSSHRDATWRWQTLYRDRIAPRFRDGRYRRAVARSLRVRESRRNPSPTFVGVIATVRPQHPLLSAKGMAALRDLRQRVGPDHVCLRTLQVTQHGVDRIRVECRTGPASFLS